MMSNKPHNQPWCAVLATAAVLSGFVSWAAAEPVKIRVGWVSAPSSLVPMIQQTGVARHNGKSYILEPVYFAASSTGITAIQAGEIDIVNVNFLTLPVAVQNAGLRDLKAVASEIEDGVGDAFSMRFMVRKDSDIKSVADLKGKTIATIGRGSGVHLGLLAIAKRNNLLENRDYTLIETPFPTMKAFLKDNKASLIVVTTGFAADPELNQIGRTLFTLKDTFEGPSALSFWAAREPFIAKNRAALVDFFEDALLANRWFTNPSNRDRAIEIVAELTKLPPAALQQWVFKDDGDFFRDPNLAVKIDMLQKNVDQIRKLGIIKQDFDVKAHTDLSVMAEAAARLK
jgi:sulfonate transport system substrate-binding protein